MGLWHYSFGNFLKWTIFFGPSKKGIVDLCGTEGVIKSEWNNWIGIAFYNVNFKDSDQKPISLLIVTWCRLRVVS